MIWIPITVSITACALMAPAIVVGLSLQTPLRNYYSMLDNIINFSIKNKLIIGLMTLLLIVWGVWSAARLPIDALPDITDNQVQVITRSPTLAAQEVEQYVTSPIEKSLANLPDIKEMRSFSRFGLSVITACSFGPCRS